MKNFLASTKRVEKAQAKLGMGKVAGAAKTRISARQLKETQRRKNALESSALPAKLADCRSADNERTELFIVEGDSALGTAKLARDSEFQAEEHTSELQSLMRISYAVFCLKKKTTSDQLTIEYI